MISTCLKGSHIAKKQRLMYVTQVLFCVLFKIAVLPQCYLAASRLDIPTKQFVFCMCGDTTVT